MKWPSKSQFPPGMSTGGHKLCLFIVMSTQLELSTKHHQAEALAVPHHFQECDKLCVVVSGEFRSAAFPIQKEASKQF